MKNFRIVRIHDLDSDMSYDAKTENDCIDSTDLSVFREVLETDDIITMGKIIGQPVSTSVSFGGGLYNRGKENRVREIKGNY